MRGTSDQQIESLVALTPEDLVPEGHPIRRIKPLADRVLQELSPTFSPHVRQGRPALRAARTPVEGELADRAPTPCARSASSATG